MGFTVLLTLEEVPRIQGFSPGIATAVLCCCRLGLTLVFLLLVFAGFHMRDNLSCNPPF